MADDFKKPLISTKQVSCKINDISTEIVCSDFGDKYLVLITQYGKMGTLVQIGKESHMINNGDTENIDIKVLLGKDEPLTYVYAKQIGSSLFGRGMIRPILLGIAFKDQTPETLKQVVQYIGESDIFL
ncbi:proteasome assembly chaperone 3-like isoform X1 [Dendronephthya gigantea]|uniref:proteasome assembly chaperone 3-like isoform X1 n=1 Tax=Dendronephthya gigantea TaxID=151771 RepID=UPI00106B517A|nr:proteasome assembly chaperone 3-like isoform X1 [Dendronephthya gigantea]